MPSAGSQPSCVGVILGQCPRRGQWGSLNVELQELTIWRPLGCWATREVRTVLFSLFFSGTRQGLGLGILELISENKLTP